MATKDDEQEKLTDPDRLLAQVRLFSKMAVDAATKLHLSDAALRSSQASSAAIQLDEHIMNGGALPSDWAAVLEPKYNPNHVWVDSSTMMVCCMDILIANKDDPDANKEGAEARCPRCGSRLALRQGIWKHGLPAMPQDYSEMTVLSALPEYINSLRSAFGSTEDD